MTPLPRDLLDVTCTACGCLCDDIAIQKSGDGWRADNACSRGDAWFRDAAGGPPVEALIGGRSASLNDALAEAGRVWRPPAGH